MPGGDLRELASYLVRCSRTSLGDFYAARLGRASNLERDLRDKLREWVLVMGSVELADFLRQHGEEIIATRPLAIEPAQPKSAKSEVAAPSPLNFWWQLLSDPRIDKTSAELFVLMGIIKSTNPRTGWTSKLTLRCLGAGNPEGYSPKNKKDWPLQVSERQLKRITNWLEQIHVLETDPDGRDSDPHGRRYHIRPVSAWLSVEAIAALKKKLEAEALKKQLEAAKRCNAEAKGEATGDTGVPSSQAKAKPTGDMGVPSSASYRFSYDAKAKTCKVRTPEKDFELPGKPPRVLVGNEHGTVTAAEVLELSFSVAPGVRCESTGDMGVPSSVGKAKSTGDTGVPSSVGQGRSTGDIHVPSSAANPADASKEMIETPIRVAEGHVYVKHRRDQVPYTEAERKAHHRREGGALWGKDLVTFLRAKKLPDTTGEMRSLEARLELFPNWVYPGQQRPQAAIPMKGGARHDEARRASRAGGAITGPPGKYAGFP